MFGFLRRRGPSAAVDEGPSGGCLGCSAQGHLAVHDLLSPVDGSYLSIEQVSDPAFSQKVLGDGFAIVPTNSVVVAPVSGRLVMKFPSGHAYGLRTDDGLELIVHVGIDTVNEGGRGFESAVEQGQQIKAGDELVRFDREGLAAKGYDTSVVTVVTSQLSSAPNKPLSDGEKVIAGKTVAMVCT